MHQITMQQLVGKAFARHARRPCLAWEGGSATYAQTARRVAVLVDEMERTIPAEAHVAILLPNGRAFIELILACAAGARVRVPISDREPLHAVAAKLRHSDCRLLFTTESWYEQLRDEMGSELPRVVLVAEYDEIVSRNPSGRVVARAELGDRYRLSFTGGTTGAAKAVVETHRQELALVRNLLLEVISPAADRVFVAATPLSHASGAFIVPTFLRGGQLAWTDRFDAERLVSARWLGESLRLQTFVVPTALGDLAEAAAGSHDLETVVYGGAPCPQPVLERAVATIGTGLIQVYGQAEAAMTICVLGIEPDGPTDLAGCAGYPFLHVDVTIEDEHGRPRARGEVGEVVVRSDHIMDGYWADPQATAARLTADGGLRTQDLGRMDEDGRLWLVGRSREMFISGGYNVFPGEVERRLGAIDGARDLAVFGVTHPRWGEATVLALVPTIDASEADLRARVEAAGDQRLAAYERPKAVVFVAELPLTSVGKVSRAGLSTQFEDLFQTA